MDRVLDKLERIFGRFAIERFAALLVAGTGAVFLLRMVRPDLAAKTPLVPQLALHEPWRFLTFAFTPQETSPIFFLLVLMSIYWVGNSLEATWGAFKLNVYYLVGMLGVIVASFISGKAQTGWFLNESMFFALATLAPEAEAMVFVVSVRLKWLALVGLILIGFQFQNGDAGDRVGIVVSFANYFLFFTGHLVRALGGRKLAARQAARRTAAAKSETKARSRVCAICGARQDDGADIRVCSCEECGGKPRDLCLTHARNH
jgi:hypothetical protein